MDSIQGGTAPVFTSDDYLAIVVEDAQTIVIQCREQPANLAYSEGGLGTQYASIDLPLFSDELPEQVVLTFPLKAYSGTLYFRSNSSATEASIRVWSMSCGNGGMY